MKPFSYRQIHLDFHTSEAIGEIGRDFTRKQFQDMLHLGHVSSITVFAKCHHGWAYFPSEANEQHPGLHFDLLGEMVEAAHEIGVNTPIYVSAGLDEKVARRHPEWIVRNADESTTWVKDFLTPGYHLLCFNTPYLDVLVGQVEEVVSKYDGDGIFLDICSVHPCYCQHCASSLRQAGRDIRNPDDVRWLAEKVYQNYTQRLNSAIHAIRPDLRVFHNGGHIERGRRDLAHMDTHLELESLPTGGWGYDHFPLSARYAATLGMDYLGMTGKFHTSWGEFGGYKHPNALRYEAALALANGARISVGDQLHPLGKMDEATYRLIGAAYAEVEAKEPWCLDAQNIGDVGLLSAQAAAPGSRHDLADVGAVRMLLEGKYLFDVLDAQADFSAYRVLILPDHVRLGGALLDKVRAFVAGGGQVLCTGESGLTEERGEAPFIALNLGVRWLQSNPYRPDYFRPAEPFADWADAAFVFYGQGQRVALDGGVELGRRENPYFNREAEHFCSHQHTPDSLCDGGPGMVRGRDGIYIAWNVFEDYATKGSLALKRTVQRALDLLLGQGKTLQTSLGAQGIVTLTHQSAQRRYVSHLLYASAVKRGDGIEVIEDIVDIHDVAVTLRLPVAVRTVKLEPQGEPLAFEQCDGELRYTLPKLHCHQMVVLEY